MNLLVDTHVLFWWLTDDPQLSAPASDAIESETNTVFVSSASIWEIAIKVKLAKWPEAEPLLKNIASELEAEEFEVLAIVAKPPPVYSTGITKIHSIEC